MLSLLHSKLTLTFHLRLPSFVHPKMTLHNLSYASMYEIKKSNLNSMWNMIHMTTLTNDPYYFRNESRQCSGTRSDLMMFRWLEVNTALKLKSKFFCCYSTLKFSLKNIIGK